MNTRKFSRRTALKFIALGIASLQFSMLQAHAGVGRAIRKRIPGTEEMLPVIGLGTWRTFNVGSDTELRDARARVVDAFFDEGGGMIDSSPMYGSAQEVIGHALAGIGKPESLFSADKVWTRDGSRTREQIRESEAHWGIERFDLIQIHNLLSWEAHLENLRQMKRDGEIRYIGITTSHGRRHGELERIMNAGGIDFVQLTYNITHREVEQRLLPLAGERGIAVIANRPYDGGSLIHRLKEGNHPLPEWATAFGCGNWAEFLLKFIVSHPHVTCAIPATTRIAHLRENMGAGRGELPDAKARTRMIEHIRSL